MSERHALGCNILTDLKVCDCSFGRERERTRPRAEEYVDEGLANETPLTPLGVAMQESEKLKFELRACEEAYGAYIADMHKIQEELLKKNAELDDYNTRLCKDIATISEPKPTHYKAEVNQENLIAFCDGSYKKIKFSAWKHSQWIHYTRLDGKQVRINPKNVNYIEEI